MVLLISLFTINCLNTFQASSLWKSTNALSELEKREMSFIEKMVLENSSKNFLVILRNKDDLPLIDTCVCTENVYWVEMESYIAAIRNSKTLDWKTICPKLHNGYTDATYDFNSIDYIIWNETIPLSDLNGNIEHYPYAGFSSEYGELIEKPMDEPKILKLQNIEKAPLLDIYSMPIELP